MRLCNDGRGDRDTQAARGSLVHQRECFEALRLRRPALHETGARQPPVPKVRRNVDAEQLKIFQLL